MLIFQKKLFKKNGLLIGIYVIEKERKGKKKTRRGGGKEEEREKKKGKWGRVRGEKERDC